MKSLFHCILWCAVMLLSRSVPAGQINDLYQADVAG